MHLKKKIIHIPTSSTRRISFRTSDAGKSLGKNEVETPETHVDVERRKPKHGRIHLIVSLSSDHVERQAVPIIDLHSRMNHYISKPRTEVRTTRRRN